MSTSERRRAASRPQIEPSTRQYASSTTNTRGLRARAARAGQVFAVRPERGLFRPTTLCVTRKHKRRVRSARRRERDYWRGPANAISRYTKPGGRAMRNWAEEMTAAAFSVASSAPVRQRTRGPDVVVARARQARYKVSPPNAARHHHGGVSRCPSSCGERSKGVDTCCGRQRRARRVGEAARAGFSHALPASEGGSKEAGPRTRTSPRASRSTRVQRARSGSTSSGDRTCR